MSEDFIRCHEDSLVMVWQLTKRLFDLTEELASNEISRDLKSFIMRENIKPNQPKSQKKKKTTPKKTDYTTGNQLIPENRENSALIFEEQKTAFEPLDLQLVEFSNETSKDWADENFYDALT